MARPAKGSPFGGAGAERLRGQGCCQTALHCDRSALTKSLPIAARRLSGDGLALSVIASQCHLSQGERLWHSASLPVSFCRSLWYTYFAPGALALTPDQQDGMGGKNLLLLQKNLFFQTLCRQAGKTALYPECPAAKKLRTTLALPLKSLWVQKRARRDGRARQTDAGNCGVAFCCIYNFMLQQL